MVDTQEDTKSKDFTLHLSKEALCGQSSPPDDAFPK